MSRLSPVSALLAGTVAGIAGCLAQDLFFRMTRKIAPSSPEDAFAPPEPAQQEESPPETVARRAVEGLAQRPLAGKHAAGTAVHFAYGTGWGAAYGLFAESFQPVRQLPGGLGFGALVWAVGEGLVLPGFRLAAPPTKYPVKLHAYQLAAHLVYGATVELTYVLCRKVVGRPLVALLGAAYMTRRWPKFARPTARQLSSRGINAALRARETIQVLQ